MLVVGRSTGLEESERNRLAWRTEKVLVNSIPVYCLTFDDLFSQLRTRFNYYVQAAHLDVL